MIRLTHLFAATLTAMSLGVAGQTKPAPEALAKSLQQRYQGIKDFSADFVHNYRGGVLKTDRKSTRLNSSHLGISYAVFCLKKKKENRLKYHKKQRTVDNDN